MATNEAPPKLPVAANAVLRSWNHIAFYVGTSITTVCRWERNYHFPVHRTIRCKQADVFAFTTEVDDWLRSRTDYMKHIDVNVAANARMLRFLPWLMLTVKETRPARVKPRSIA